MPRITELAMNYLGRPSAVVTWALITGGVFLLQDGIKRSVMAANRSEAWGARAPLPYGTAFTGWRPVVGQDNGDRAWYLLLSDSSQQHRVCPTLLSMRLSAETLTRLIVLQPHRTPSGQVVSGHQACNVDGTVVRIVEAETGRLGPNADSMIVPGFTMLDSAFHVVYGSRRMGDAHWIAPVMELLSRGGQDQ